MPGRYIQFKDADYTELRRKLLRTKGSDEQRHFLDAVRESTLPKYLNERLEVEGTKAVPLSPEPLTEDEFKEPPSDTEQRLYRAWSALTPSITCRTTFWAHLTCRHVEARLIHSPYLAANGDATIESGAERIDIALYETGAEADKLLDGCVRTVLRKLGGIREARGARTVYVDCPFARAWWREHLVQQIAGHNEDLADDVRYVFHVSQTYWEKIVDRVVSRNSTFGSFEVRNALLRRLAEMLRDPSSPMARTANLVHVCRQVAAQQGVRELSVLSGTELADVIDKVLQPD